VTSDGTLTSCWKLSWKERLKVLFTGKVYCAQLTFGRSLQQKRGQVHLQSFESSQREAEETSAQSQFRPVSPYQIACGVPPFWGIGNHYINVA